MIFDKKGKQNTVQTLELAYKKGRELGLDEVVLASTSGFTAVKAVEIFKGFKIIAVSHHCGFKEK